MPRLQASIEIALPPRQVFDITNDIDRWKDLFKEYAHSEVVLREDEGRFSKIVFQLRNKEGSQWQSWRILDHRDMVAIAEREDPLYPFRFMHLRWTYAPTPAGTLMTWIQDFELDEKAPYSESDAVEFMNRHGEVNQRNIKEVLESPAFSSSSR